MAAVASTMVSVELNSLSGVTQLAACAGLLWSADPACRQPDTWASDLIVKNARGMRLEGQDTWHEEGVYKAVY